MSEPVSLVRLYLLRLAYLVNFAFLGSQVWPEIVGGDRVWESMPGVAFSFWAALSALSALGFRYPVAMLPLLLLQLFYKVVYLLAVGLPLEIAPGQKVSILSVFVGGVVMDLVVIPWPHVVTRLVRARGDRWRGSASADTPHSSHPDARHGVTTGRG
ncbi:MAG: hypothetical protein ACREA0_06440 [bacterium]